MMVCSCIHKRNLCSNTEGHFAPAKLLGGHLSPMQMMGAQMYGNDEEEQL